MFDTIVMHIEDARLESRVLSDAKLISSGEGDWSFTAGYHENLRVSFGRNGVIIAGSFAKYQHGNNITPLMPSDIPRVLERLSTGLGIDVSRGVVRRVDVGATLLLSQCPEHYLTILADLPRTKRVAHGLETVSFIGRSKTLVFYDKWLELSTKRGRKLPTTVIQSIPRNLLRYEFQIKVSRSVNVLRAEKLAEAGVYQKLIQRWHDAYLSVSKSSIGPDLPQSLTTAKRMVLGLAAIGLHEIGGLGRALDIVARRSTLSPMQKSRLGKQLRFLASMEGDGPKADVVRELDNAVAEIAKAAIAGAANPNVFFTIDSLPRTSEATQ